MPNFNNPPEAARAWADEYEARMKAEKEVRLALEAKEKIEKEKRMVQAELNTAIDTIKENEPVIDMFKGLFQERVSLSVNHQSILSNLAIISGLRTCIRYYRN